MKYLRLLSFPALLLLFSLFVVLPNAIVEAQTAVVRGLLFFSPACSHCHFVMDEVLPPLAEQYGEQLEIVPIDVSQPAGQKLYQAAISNLSIPESRVGVPTLVVDNIVMVGSQEIPQQLPGLIDQRLAAGGNGWPDIPGLTETLAAAGIAAGDTSPLMTTISEAEAADSASMLDKLQRDPLGNMLAVLVLVAMIAAIVFAVWRAVQIWQSRYRLAPAESLLPWQYTAVLILALIGLGVSIYMAYVETTHATAVCGPVGDCNTVQQSQYAELFGWLPLGVAGIVGYAAMIVTWAGMKWGTASLRHASGLVLFFMALAGTLFSIYLTYLEPFVIGATCAWCLTSAVVMGLILVIMTPPAPQPSRTTVRRAKA